MQGNSSEKHFQEFEERLTQNVIVLYRMVEGNKEAAKELLEAQKQSFTRRLEEHIQKSEKTQSELEKKCESLTKEVENLNKKVKNQEKTIELLQKGYSEKKEQANALELLVVDQGLKLEAQQQQIETQQEIIRSLKQKTQTVEANINERVAHSETKCLEWLRASEKESGRKIHEVEEMLVSEKAKLVSMIDDILESNRFDLKEHDNAFHVQLEAIDKSLKQQKTSVASQLESLQLQLMAADVKSKEQDHRICSLDLQLGQNQLQVKEILESLYQQSTSQSSRLLEHLSRVSKEQQVSASPAPSPRFPHDSITGG